MTVWGVLMVTVGIMEHGEEIRQLIAFLFKSTGIKFCTGTCRSEKDYILLKAKKGQHYDVLLENSTASEQNCTADYIHLINSDDVPLSNRDEKSLFITYGLNSLATATASSIIEDGESLRFQYCLQRNIVSLKGKIIECQEFPVCIYKENLSLHCALAFVTLALVCSVPAKGLENLIVKS